MGLKKELNLFKIKRKMEIEMTIEILILWKLIYAAIGFVLGLCVCEIIHRLKRIAEKSENRK